MAFRTNKTPVLQEKSASGSVASFNTALAMPLKSCTSLISGYQEGSGVPSPSNVRPLHAWSSASLGKCDNNTASLWTIDNSFNGDVEFNQLAGLSGVNTQTSSNVTFTKNNDNSYTISGTANGRVLTSNVVIGRFYTVTNHKYLFSISEPITPLRLREQNFSLPFISGSTVVNCSEGKNAFFTFDSTVDISGTSFNVSNLYINIFDLTQMFGSTIADYIYNLEIQTAGAGVAFFKSIYPNDYYPYNAGTKQLVGDTLATFTFGQSIYQGSIDWKRGVVVATWGMVDLGSMTYYEYGSTDTVTQYYTNGLDLLAKSTADIACSIFYKNATKLGWTSFIIATGSADRTYMRTPKDYYSDATAFKTAMNGVMLAYELATPIEIQLSGIQIDVLEGVNNIWADTGDISLTYKDLDIAKRGNFREVFKLPS